MNPAGRNIKACSDEEFISLFRREGPTVTAKILGVTERSVYHRRKNLQKIGPAIAGPANIELKYPHRLQNAVKNGHVLVGSDFHIWPGQDSLALRAFKKLTKEIKPSIIVLNGDVLDFPRISRHQPIGWEGSPLPEEEIEAAQDHLQDIVAASSKARKIWTLGNHDARFETRLASVASEYKGLYGIHLSDHFPLWEKCWSTWINDDVVIKHRFKGGVHATHNNAVYSGKTVITGHLHSAKVTPFSDYNGTRFGVDTGCVADTHSKQFMDYTEDNPLNWISGFCLLTFKDGRLLWPELITKFDDNHMQWRGQLLKV